MLNTQMCHDLLQHGVTVIGTAGAEAAVTQGLSRVRARLCVAQSGRALDGVGGGQATAAQRAAKLRAQA